MIKHLVYINIIGLLLAGFTSQSQDFDNFYHGVASYSEGDYKLANDFFDKSLNDNLDTEIVLKYKANCYYLSGNIDLAIETYKKLKEYNLSESSYGLAICYADKKEISLSLSELKIHLSQDNKIPRGAIRLNKKFRVLKSSDGWDELWYGEWYNKYDQLYEDAEYYFNKSKHDRAFELLEDLLDRKPRHHKAYALRAKVYESTGDLKKAKNDYSIAISIKKKNSSYYKGRAQIYRLLEKNESALDDLKTAFELDKYDPHYLYLMADELFLSDKMNEAQNNLNQYLRFFENDEEAQYLLGKCYFENESYSKAIDQFTTALELNPSEPKYYLGRGNCYLMLDDLDKSENDLSMALDLNPKLALVYMSRGIVRLNKDEMEGACRDFNKAYKFGHLKAIELIHKHCNN